MAKQFTNRRFAAAAIVAMAILGGCTGRGGGALPASPQAAAPLEAAGSDASILNQLTRQVVIGSTVDPISGAGNPYGLTVAPISSGKLKAGDLVVCNFNGRSGTQGSGKSIVALHNVAGSKPVHVSGDPSLLGCDALALEPSDSIWAAAMVANDNPVIAPNGKLVVNIKGKPFTQPWGQAYAQPTNGKAAFYETNAGDGSVVRINLGSTFTYDAIAKGFPVNHGQPGTALAPSGLAYDARIDTLYFADGTNNTIVALENVTKIRRGGVIASADGMTFAGPSAADARIVFAGKPLNGPISTALLPNGNLVIGNTLDPNGKNLLIEISAAGKLLAVRNVDKGAAGALFGIVAPERSAADTKIYFNDDNDNELEVLER